MQAGDGVARSAKVVGAALAGGIAVAGLFSLDLPLWLREMTAQYGPGFFMIAVVMAGIAYYIPRNAVMNFVMAQQQQAIALAGIKDEMSSMSRQAEQIRELREILSEVLVNQHVNGDRLKNIETRLAHGYRENDE